MAARVTTTQRVPVGELHPDSTLRSEPSTGCVWNVTAEDLKELADLAVRTTGRTGQNYALGEVSMEAAWQIAGRMQKMVTPVRHVETMIAAGMDDTMPGYFVVRVRCEYKPPPPPPRVPEQGTTVHTHPGVAARTYLDVLPQDKSAEITVITRNTYDKSAVKKIIESATSRMIFVCKVPDGYMATLVPALEHLGVEVVDRTVLLGEPTPDAWVPGAFKDFAVDDI